MLYRVTFRFGTNSLSKSRQHQLDFLADSKKVLEKVVRRINVCQLSHLGGKDRWEKRKRSITEVGRWALDRGCFCCAVEDATSFQENL